jgi:hypothetical protein
MEALTRLVSESLARYGLDRPVDYRRLQWSRWFRCESLHSLLCVPSKPGVFALAEEIMEFVGNAHVGTAAPPTGSGQALGCPAEQGSAGCGGDSRRMLAVLQFGEDDDMAFVLDRMLSRDNPMRARLLSGRCFVRFVVIEDASQRRSICNALNQWMISSGEKASGIGAHFASSLELNVARDDRVGRTFFSASPSIDRVAAGDSPAPACTTPSMQAKLDLKTAPETEPPARSHLDSGAATNIHCPQPLPSGF